MRWKGQHLLLGTAVKPRPACQGSEKLQATPHPQTEAQQCHRMTSVMTAHLPKALVMSSARPDMSHKYQNIKICSLKPTHKSYRQGRMDTDSREGQDTAELRKDKESPPHDLPGWAIHEKEDKDLLKQTWR